MLLLHPGMTKRLMLISGDNFRDNHNLGGQNSSRLQAGSMYIMRLMMEILDNLRTLNH